MKRITDDSESESDFFEGWLRGALWEIRWWLALFALFLLAGGLVFK